MFFWCLKMFFLMPTPFGSRISCRVLPAIYYQFPRDCRSLHHSHGRWLRATCFCPGGAVGWAHWWHSWAPPDALHYHTGSPRAVSLQVSWPHGPTSICWPCASHWHRCHSILEWFAEQRRHDDGGPFTGSGFHDLEWWRLRLVQVGSWLWTAAFRIWCLTTDIQSNEPWGSALAKSSSPRHSFRGYHGWWAGCHEHKWGRWQWWRRVAWSFQNWLHTGYVLRP